MICVSIVGSYGVAINFVAEGKEVTSLNEIEANCGVTITALPGIFHMYKTWNNKDISNSNNDKKQHTTYSPFEKQELFYILFR